MNKDFRLNVSVFSHPKVRRIERRHGPHAFKCLLQLWAFTAQHRPRGVLYEMDKEDIIDACGWPGDVEFVDSLLEVGLLDQGEEWIELHDWREHNGWAYHAPERAKSAREAADARWRKHKNKGESNA